VNLPVNLNIPDSDGFCGFCVISDGKKNAEDAEDAENRGDSAALRVLCVLRVKKTDSDHKIRQNRNIHLQAGQV